MSLKLSVVIPSFNGAGRLKDCIPVLFRAMAHAGFQQEVIVVDDASGDHSVEFIRGTYPQIRLLVHDINKGFISSVNDGVRACTNELVVLLNNDVIVYEDTFDTLEQDFSDKSVFAVSFQSLNDAGTFREGLKKAPFVLGFYKIRHGAQDQPLDLSRVYDTFYAVGGHCAVRRSAFLELGGMDPLFAPFYWEDLDLSFRARRAGYKVLYDPRCVVVHREIGTIKTHYGMRYIRRIRERNRLLFHWKGLRNRPFLFLQHIVFVFFRLLTGVFLLDTDFYAGFFLALKARLQRPIHL